MAGFRESKKPLLVYGIFLLISLVVLPVLQREDILYLYTWSHFHKPGFQSFIPMYSFEHISFEPQENHEGIGDRGLERTIKTIKSACKMTTSQTFEPSPFCKDVLRRHPYLREVHFVIKSRTFKYGEFKDVSFRIVMNRNEGVTVENL